MKKETTNNTYLSFLRENIFQILGFAMLVGNLWLASQLAPLASDLRVLSTRVLAVEQAQDDALSKAEFNAHLAGIKEQIIEINKKLDRLLLK